MTSCRFDSNLIVVSFGCWDLSRVKEGIKIALPLFQEALFSINKKTVKFLSKPTKSSTVTCFTQ